MKRDCGRENLLNRWREIAEEEEEEEDDEEVDGFSASKDETLRRVKEKWFSDTFKFLINLPEETHIWCGCFDLMGPLLETFHNYFNDKRTSSPLKTIWKRTSQELNQCTQCVCQLHQAQEDYSAEYEYETVGPLLKILQRLDEERIADHLEDMNTRIRQNIYDREGHASEVVSILFEVLMFPTLLDDQSLVSKFEGFIEAIDKSHELSLAGNQQYPGVYALLFLRNSKTRAIGLRLAGGMGKLRNGTDLEPLQPLLKKYINTLETNMHLETSKLKSEDTSRPIIRNEHSTVWLGFKALLGFLESPAFEEGILERHPIFLSIVLNHVSDDTPDFSSAVNCLRMFFEMLGCKLWLRTTISPSVMRNTLLGQCFHTADEKMHKEIFDLFLPFLQSLEALQDGEHEKQRRHFLYFLLHQVTHSSNFSELMRKNGCKIALGIIQRGYKINPPCPPFECSHVWGPSLVSCLKNSSLHKSLRQPAIDLIQTIIVSDCAALASMQLNLSSITTTADTCTSLELYDDEEEVPLFHDIKENDRSCWNDFWLQSKLASLVCKDWRCIPMLWHDVFIGSNPSILPMSFFKSVVWGISHLPILDSDSSIDHKLTVNDWLSTYAGEISASFMWEVPQGYDDGADGKDSKGSLSVSLYSPLIRTFKRFATQYLTTMEALELNKQLTWEPRISESLILLLVNPNDTVRHVNRIILEYFSNTKGLTTGLQFLCASDVSLYATYMGLKYATNQVQANQLLSSFHTLHHLFFVVRKILKEVVYPQLLLGNSTEKKNHSELLSEGGFLRYPCNHTTQVVSPGLSSAFVYSKLCINFSFFLSANMWPSILKCLYVGKKFIDSKNTQMTCVRLLEILPVVLEWLITTPPHDLPSSRTIVYGISDLRWLFDLVDWGKSSLTVVIRHWKLSILGIVGLLKGFHDVNNKGIFHAIEQIMSFDVVALDELKEKVSQVTLCLSKEAISSGIADMEFMKPSCSVSKQFYSEGIAAGNKDSSLTASQNVNNSEQDIVVILSDNEDENVQSRDHLQLLRSDKINLQRQNQAYVGKRILASNKDTHQESVAVHIPEDTLKSNLISEVIGDDNENFHQKETEKRDAKMLSHSLGQSVSVVKPIIKHGKHALKNSHGGTVISISKPDTTLRNTSGKSDHLNSTNQDLLSSIVNKPDALIKDYPLDVAKFSARLSSILPSKPCISVPKRKVVHLEMPTSNRRGQLSKYTEYNRHRPPKLDEWYKPILELDYFSLIGLSSDNKDNEAPASYLKEVPLCFHSPEHYVEIFQPLVLEEFKAQMHNSCLEVSSSDIFCSILCVHSVERIDDFHLIRGSVEECDSSASGEYSENDLVLLTKDPLKNIVQPFHAVGKVERRERNNKIKTTVLSVKVYLQSGLPRLVKLKKILIERSKWHISRLMSITPQLREFQALSSLNNIPLLPLILSPTSSSGYVKTSKYSLDKLPEPLQIVLKSSFNESQLKAIGISIGIQGSSKTFELSLIQGPPGTGKTKTIVAIVSALLASKIGSSKMLVNKSTSHGAAFINPRAQTSQTTAVARVWQDAALAKQIVKDEVREYSESRLSKGRILICAQSNAAVDELVSRISSGIYGNDGKFYKPFLVRVGNVKTVHPCSLPFFIDTLVEQRLAQCKNQSDTKGVVDGGSIMSLRIKLEKIVESIQLFESRRAKFRDADMENESSLENAPSKLNDTKESDTEIGGKLKILYAKKKTLCRDIATAQAQERSLLEKSKILKNKIRRSIIREAEVVVSTLSGCGGDIYGVCSGYASGKFGSFSEHSLFDAVVIDEAAQALEPATLIPLQLLKSIGTKCVMVGDPKQLPATVFSNVASKYLYECSMFERLQRGGYPVIMLMEQYRMHPEICKFPSSHFYENALVNGVSKSSMSAPFHEDSFLQPYLFFDITDGHESQGKSSGSLSLYNVEETEAVIEILKFFRNRYPSEFSAGRIGVITPYQSQLSVLRSRCNSQFGASVTADMEFKTVDGFQGREVDILLLSTVRASDLCMKNPAATSRRIGFVADVRRMNVALTRAKFSLWIVGNERTLRTDIHWAALLKDAKERGVFRSLSKPYKSCLESSRTSTETGTLSNLNYLAKHNKHCTHGGSRSRKLHAIKNDELNSQVKRKDGEAGQHTFKKPKILSYKTSPRNYHTEKYQKTSTSDKQSAPVNNLTPEVRGSQSKKCFPDHGDASGDTIKCNQDTISPLDSELKGKHGVKMNKNTKTIEAQSSKSKIKSYKDLAKGILSDGEVKKGSYAKGKEKCVLEYNDISLRNMNLSEPNVPEACIDKHIQEKVPQTQNASDQGNAYRYLTSARKRQREAVDSLLSSSLLPSRKTEASLKFAPLKKPFSLPTSESDETTLSRSCKAKQSNTKRLDE